MLLTSPLILLINSSLTILPFYSMACPTPRASLCEMPLFSYIDCRANACPKIINLDRCKNRIAKGTWIDDGCRGLGGACTTVFQANKLQRHCVPFVFLFNSTKPLSLNGDLDCPANGCRDDRIEYYDKGKWHCRCKKPLVPLVQSQPFFLKVALFTITQQFTFAATSIHVHLRISEPCTLHLWARLQGYYIESYWIEKDQDWSTNQNLCNSQINGTYIRQIDVWKLGKYRGYTGSDYSKLKVFNFHDGEGCEIFFQLTDTTNIIKVNICKK